jgi:hypothetical protein
MPEHLLHILEARPAHHQVARRGVAEVMEAAVHDTGPLQERLERRSDLTAAPIVP